MKPNTNSPEDLTRATLKGIEEARKTADATQKAQRIQAKATYDGLTSGGKSRFVNNLTEAYGSQARVADELDLSPGRISQLVNSEKNRKNGK
jgi:hypothetical protein